MSAGDGGWLTRLGAVLSGRPDRKAFPGQGASGPEPADSATPEEGESGALSGAELEQWLRRAVGGQPADFDRHIQLLSLAPVATRFGSAWAGLADKVEMAVSTAAARRLGQRDLFVRAGDHTYILVLAAGTEAEARLRCALLARDVAARLLGEDAKDADVETASISLENGHVAIMPYSKLDVVGEVLATLVPAGVAGAADPTSIEAQALKERLRSLAATAGPAQGALPREGTSPREPPPPTIGWLSEEQRLHAELTSLMARTEGAMLEEQRRRSAATATAAALASGGLGYRYEPMWHVTSRVINAYLCQPAVVVEGRLRLGRALLPADPEPKLLAALDRLVLRQCLGELRRMAAAKITNLVCVPVHHGTLVAPLLRQDYLAACAGIDASMRPLLIFEILEPMIGLSNAQLPPSVALLKTYSRAVLTRVPLDHQHVGDFARIGLAAIGAELRDDGTPEAELIPKIDLFRARADRYGLRCYLRGLATPSLTTASVYAGFEHLSGPAIGELTDSPEGVQSFSLAHFYSQNYVKGVAEQP